MKMQQACRGRYSATCGTWALHNAGFGSFKEILDEIIALNRSHRSKQVTPVDETIIRTFLTRRGSLLREDDTPTMMLSVPTDIRAIAFVIADKGGSHAVYLHEGVVLDSRETQGFTFDEFPDQLVYHLFILR